ncbi:MAG: SPFH domain-containing protein [Firmicutes bacterium]|nr:SPFH domain-containing protein [Bacillota bacterium]
MRFITRQLLKLIEWTDMRSDLIAYKFPMNDRAEIMNGSTLVVREGQVAIFVKDGKLADIYAPGRHKLTTANMPVLTTLMNWHHGFKNPFRCDVYFINTTILTGQKWGTANPFTMRDPEFGVIRIRAFGTYNFRVLDPKMLLLSLLGAKSEFSVTNIREKLRSIITSNISNVVASSKYNAIDLSTKLLDFNKLAQDSLQPLFASVGFQLTLFVVENISFPEEVERAIDSRSSVGVLSDKMGSFVAMQQAQAMRDMANNPAGIGGAFMGMGMMGGMGAGLAMNQAQDANLASGLQATPPPQPKAPAAAPVAQASAPSTKPCSKCKAQIAPNSRFCGECGEKQAQEKACPKCSVKVKKGSRFCAECGEKLG